MAAYGVSFDIEQPEKFERVHVAVRLVLVLVLSLLGGAILWLYGLAYLAVPVLAAVLISQKGTERYLAEARDNVTGWLRIVIAFQAYVFLLTDRLPNERLDEYVRFQVEPRGSPTPATALARIVFALPSLVVLAVLMVIGVVLAVIAAVMVLVEEKYPEAIYAYLRGLVRWSARLLAYMASLVEEYPPFTFDTEREGAVGETGR